MNSKVVVVLAVCFCFISLVSASTTLNIQTLPGHEIFITEIDAFANGNIAVKSPIHTFSGKSGLIELEYTPKKTSFKLGLLLKNGTRKIISYKILEDIFHDEELTEITFLPNGITLEDILASIPEEESIVEEETELIVEGELTEVIEDEVLEDEEESEEIEEEIGFDETEPGIFKSAIMQGSAVLHDNKPIVNVVSYCLIAVILAVPIFLFVKRRKGEMVDKISKLGDLLPKGDDKESSNDDEDDLKKAEEDLKKARARIEDLKGDKVKKARQKLLEDEKELMRLRNLGKD